MYTAEKLLRHWPDQSAPLAPLAYAQGNPGERPANRRKQPQCVVTSYDNLADSCRALGHWRAIPFGSIEPTPQYFAPGTWHFAPGTWHLAPGTSDL